MRKVDLYAKYPKRACKRALKGPFKRGEKKGDGFMLKEGRLSLDMKKKFTSLEVFKARLGGALNNMV